MARKTARGVSARRRLLAWTVLVLVVMAAVAGTQAWRARPPRTDASARERILGRAPRPSELNVVVVTLDTLRADRLGCYGYRGVATPNIDGVAAEGVVFEQATSTAPMTLPSHASIFTGLVPPRHGVRDNGGFFVEPEDDDARRAAEGGRLRYRRLRRRLGARLTLGARPGLRSLLGPLRPLEVQGGQPGHRAEAGRRGDGPRPWPGSRRSSRSASLPGSTCTTRTRPTSRPSRSPRATPASPTWARSRTPIRWSVDSCHG